MRVTDAQGGWAAVRVRKDVPLTEAWLERDGERLPVDVGTDLRLTDVLVTRRARVQVKLRGKGDVTVYEYTRVRLEDWGLLHELGGLLIEVQGAFKVEYATAEAVVEGTRFRVESTGPDEGLVSVEEGVVRVITPQGEVRVQPWEQAVIGSGVAPVKQTVPAHAAGGGVVRPRVATIGLQVGGGVGDHLGLDSAAGELRADLLGRLRLGPIGGTASFGLVNSSTTSHFPMALGAEYWLGPVSLGVQGDLLFGAQESCTGDREPIVVGGAGHLTAGLRLSLAERLLLDGRALAGWSTGPQAYGTLGLSYAL